MRRVKVWIGIGCLSGGGAEKQVELLAKGIDPEKFDLRVGYVRKSNNEPDFSKEVQQRFYPRNATLRWDQIWRQIYAEFKNWRPDVVHVWLPEVISVPAAVIGRLQGIPVISSVRRSYFKGIGWRAYGRECLGLIPHVFSRGIVSNFPLDHEPPLLRAFFKRRACRVIRNGVIVRDQQAVPAPLGQGKPVHFVFVGRFARQKRLPFLLQTLASLDAFPWTLTVFGTGVEKEEKSMRDLVARLDLQEKVCFRGFAPNWRDESHRFHYMLFPSVSEGMPNVVVEAMAEGLPVIGSRIPELAGILIDAENGFYFEPDSEDSLLAALTRIHCGDHASLSEGARSTSCQFSVKALIENYEQLYRSVSERGEL